MCVLMMVEAVAGAPDAAVDVAAVIVDIADEVNFVDDPRDVENHILAEHFVPTFNNMRCIIILNLKYTMYFK